MNRLKSFTGKGVGVASLALASILAGACLLGPLAAPVAAQELLAPLDLGQQGLDPQALDQSSTTPLNPEPALQDEVSIGTGATLRGLDKINGDTLDVTVPSGSAVMVGKLSVTMWECRYPEGNEAGDAFAFMTITEPAKSADPIFSGWMIASSPGLNPLDHFRYDIWVLSCTTS
ncbi:hypothetical protein NBRC116586_24580 [Pseudooceanicola nitratireducens]|uniref:DUF2155 domain-containing protein n=1 Tax=Pseudooceanicola nitratireducens TaxID=517719 RepID=UPI00310986E8